MLGLADANRSFLVVETQKEPSMRFANSIFVGLLKPIDRRRFGEIVDAHDGDAYDKSFKSWDHLVALVYAQLARLDGSTLSDANARRPVGIFAQTFAMLSTLADRRTRQQGAAMVRLIDASPVPLHTLCKWAKWNGRIRGMKLHVVYDPVADVPIGAVVTAANVNDIEIGRQVAIKAGTTYVFDKAYCRFDWWQNINDCEAFFVTRTKRKMRLRASGHRPLRQRNGDGFKVLADDEVKLASKGDSRLPIPLRRIRIRRNQGGVITLLTNDLNRPAVEIAALYKSRWQIELLFRWIKQHLDIRNFLGTSDNAVRLQILAAMIAYLLLRLAARLNRVTMLPLRLAELIQQFLFSRRTIATIATPPPVNPSRPRPPISPGQLEFCYV